MSQSIESSFLDGVNIDYITGLYARYLEDPTSVDPSWQGYFKSLNDEDTSILIDGLGLTWQDEKVSAFGAAPSQIGSTSFEDLRLAAFDAIQARMMVHRYRVKGHLLSALDPLHLTKQETHPELDPAVFGFRPQDMDRSIVVDAFGKHTATPRELLNDLKAAYCGTIGAEFMHLLESEKRDWIQSRIEGFPKKRNTFSPQQQKEILEGLTRAESFEKFLSVKFPGAKRFGLEGLESVIPGIEAILHRGSELGLEEVIFGMAHRGRLNVLSNILGKPYASIFAEFQGLKPYPENTPGSGDVKYHLGASSDKMYGGKSIHLSLTPNPSHLEAVNTVVLGKVRAKQALRQDLDRSKVMGILLHGDAAFPGQGIVAETLLLSKLQGYKTGGTIHIVTNNQIGFTTSPQYSRSSHYCTDIAKAVEAPIFHVNGDDVEAVVMVCQLAMDYRQAFGEDVVIDIWGFRKNGHNEMDEPMFTQPEMYKVISKQPTTLTQYKETLLSRGTLGESEIKAIQKAYTDTLEASFKASTTHKLDKADWLDSAWKEITFEPAQQAPKTGVQKTALQEVAKALTTIPSGFNLNSKVARGLDQKKTMMAEGQGIDWGTGEALAFGSLLKEGYPVRLSGQDCGRGTFSHRHSVWTDQQTGLRFVPLNSISMDQGTYEVVDSPLSEYGVLGFEYGYSITDPNALNIWEAQFGDFANGAQIMFDQFISSAETKWLRMSGLVVLLPHGYEGQGPEHSSARLERFLQLCAENNMQVVYPSTPASYFHLLRRQLHRTIRKPLIVMTPKSLLRHKGAVSSLAELAEGSTFQPVIGDPLVKPPTRVILCSGKVYYELLEARKEMSTAIIRLEQLYPFPGEELKAALAGSENAPVIWCQEEPQNMGSWFYLDRKIEGVLKALNFKNNRPYYAGRREAASPATGSHHTHDHEQQDLVAQALTGSLT